MPIFRRFLLIMFISAFFIVQPVWAEQGLSNCAAQFPGGQVENAPAAAQTGPETPGSGNVHMCKRWGETSFFALEYDPRRFTSIWVAYRISDTFGENGCTSMTRRAMQCHFSADNVEACVQDKTARAADPFHPEPLLQQLGLKPLGTGTFSGTGHDRGHLAPNNSFSWHACGAYKTFTMANMAAQWGSHNREIWSKLEAQVLYWGVKEGPIHVVTGPIWTAFPSDRFKAIREGQVDTAAFVKPGEMLRKTSGAAVSLRIPRPTGFYKVIYQPPKDSSPGRAVAFLVPHTTEKGLGFWHFISTVALVEEASGLRFGLSDELKGGRNQRYWTASRRRMPRGWDLRSGCTSRPPVPGWRPELTRDQRRELCESSQPGG